jgi:hypothetical protein
MDWSVALAYLMLATFTPSFLCVQILQYIYTKAYRFFFGRSCRRRYNLPQQYLYLVASYVKRHGPAKPIWLIFDVSLPPLSNTVSGSSPNVDNIPRSTTVSAHHLQLVTKRGQYTHVYYCKRPLPPTAKFAPDDPNIPSDHPCDVHARAMWQPNRLDVDRLISYMNPLQQYQMIRQISDPSLFETKQSQKKTRSSMKRALLYASKIVTCNPSYSAAPSSPILYLSRKDNDLPIVINSGASLSVSLTISDFVSAIRPCCTTHLNGLKGKINVVGERDVEWTVQDIFGTTRKLRSTAYCIPGASVRLFLPQTYLKNGAPAPSKWITKALILP